MCFVRTLCVSIRIFDNTGTGTGNDTSTLRLNGFSLYVQVVNSRVAILNSYYVRNNTVGLMSQFFTHKCKHRDSITIIY